MQTRGGAFKMARRSSDQSSDEECEDEEDKEDDEEDRCDVMAEMK